MIEMISLAADNVVGFRVRGKVTEREFGAVAAVLDAKGARHGRLRVYAEIESLTGMSMRALLEDARLGWRSWRLLEKEAIVTDKPWLRCLSAAADMVQPGIAVRAFPTAERDAARVWVQS